MICKILNQKVKDWELFNLANDRTETINLAAEFPDKVKTWKLVGKKNASGRYLISTFSLTATTWL